MAQKNISSPLPDSDALKSKIFEIIEQKQGMQYNDPPSWTTYHSTPEEAEQEFIKNPESAPGDYGPPEGWNWQTSKTGWQGEDLPYGAQSWDNFGRPYYGPGVKGWLNKFFSKMNAPFTNDPDRGVWETKQQDLINEETGEKIGTMPGPNFAKIWENLKSGEGTTPIAYAARAVEAIAGSGLEVFAQPAREQKRVMGAIGEVGEIGGGYNAGDITKAPEWIQNLVSGVAPEQLGTADTRDLRDVVGVPDADWNTIKKSWDRGYNAGKILYTGVIDPMKREEFIKRYEAGENPDLLAIELENPLAEMAGELVFDPLNFVGVPIKAIRNARRVRNVRAEFIDLPDDLNDALRFMDASGDARSAESMDNILNATQKAFDDTKTGLDKFSKTTGSLYTADAKRWQVGRRTGEVASWIASHSQGATDAERAENTLQMYRALADMASGDKAKIAAAYKTISHFVAPRPLLSRAGRELGIVLNDMLSDKKFLEQLVEATGRGQAALPGMKKVSDVNALDNMLKFAEQKLGKTIDDMFPSVDDLLKREAELKKAGKAITDPVPDWVRAVNNVNNKLQKVVGPTNRGLSWVYMGKNPGYTFRNISNNELTLFVDYGPGIFAKKPFTSAQETDLYLKGTTPRSMSGFSQAGSFEQTIKPMTYEGEDLAKAFAEAVRRGDFTKAADIAEKAAAVRVVGYTVKKVMNDLMQPGKGLPDLADAVAKGLPPETVNWFLERLRANYFDVDSTFAELMGKIKTGQVEVFRSGDWISNAQWEQLRAYDLSNPLHDILANAKTKQEAQQQLAELLAEKRRIAGSVVDEVFELNTETEVAQSYVNFADELQETTARSGSYYIDANQNANLAYREALDELIQLSPNNQDLLLARRSIQEAGSEVAKSVQERYQTTRAYVEQAFRKGFNFEDAWNALGDGSSIPFRNPKEFKQWMWDQYCFPFVRNSWDEYRKASAATIEKLARDVGQGNAGKIVNARKLNVEADMWMKTSRFDQFRLQLDDAINAGDNAGMARVIANKYGIPSVSESGAPLDRRILDTINKYSDVKYDSLADIKDQKIIDDAFSKRISDKAAQAVPGSEATQVAQAPAAKAAKTPKAKDLSTYAPATQKFFAPRKELEATPYGKVLSERIKAEAATMLSEYGGTTRVPVGDKAPGIWVTRSNNPEWYKTIYWEGSKNKDAVFNALKRIIDDEGKDLIKPRDETILRVKQEILGRLAGGDEWGNPPDISYMLWTGRTDEAAIAYGRMQAQMNAASGADLSFGVTNLQDTFPWLDDATMAKLEGRYFDIVGELDKGDYKHTADWMRKTGRYSEEEIDARLLDDWMQQNIKPVYAEEGSEALAVIEPELVDPVAPPSTPPPPYSAGAKPTAARAATEGMQGLEQLFKQIGDGFERNWGRTQEVVGNPELNKALTDWRKVAARQAAEARLIAANTANAARDFTVLAYPNKTYLDLAAAYVFPYQFWYSRSYAHWMERIATDPQVLAAYARYKDTLSKIHAGAPEWYKYNLNTNDLPGVDVKNPLFFNLEATLWPLNGLTGIDFTDKYKRVNWWTKTLDDLNKFGPSTWTPLSIAAAVALQVQGEEDAASRWGGRLIPQTATAKSLLNLLNINLQTREGINEFDPMVQLFSDGMDPYERNRVGRALYTLVEEGVIDRETAIEASRVQSGDAWRMATIRAIHDRAGGQMSSFFLGVGFKARNVTDVQIDQYYAEQYRLWNMADTMTPAEYRRQNDALKDKFPFMDSVLLAKKAGPEKDTAYAYNVLSRLPPGQADDIFRAMDIDYKFNQMFYDSKGDMSSWSESDRTMFMNAIVDMGAILKLPESATRREWTEASIAYSKMNDDIEKQFGAEGVALFDKWLSMGEDIKGKRELQEANPVIDAIGDFKDDSVMANPILRQYYASIETVERYHQAYMNALLEKQYGADIYDIQTGYNDQMTYKDQKAYKKQYPQLEKYWDAKKEYKKTIAELIVATGKRLKEGLPALTRTDEAESVNQEKLLEGLDQERVPEYYQYSYSDWMQNFPPEMQRLLEDYVYGSKDLPNIAQKELEYIAGQMNEEPEIILELIEQSAR